MLKIEARVKDIKNKNHFIPKRENEKSKWPYFLKWFICFNLTFI